MKKNRQTPSEVWIDITEECVCVREEEIKRERKRKRKETRIVRVVRNYLQMPFWDVNHIESARIRSSDLLIESLLLSGALKLTT